MTGPQVGGGQREKADALDRPMGDILPGSDSQDTILAYLDVSFKIFQPDVRTLNLQISTTAPWGISDSQGHHFGVPGRASQTLNHRFEISTLNYGVCSMKSVLWD